MPLTRRQYKFLKWAVHRAEEWRGAEIGNPDPKPLRDFDANIKEAKLALKQQSPYTTKGDTSS
jgi:hypothetical protein